MILFDHRLSMDGGSSPRTDLDASPAFLLGCTDRDPAFPLSRLIEHVKDAQHSACFASLRGAVTAANSGFAPAVALTIQ